ncbi:MAG: hypothetical protein ABI039_12125, partial [Vicinamibacterales bacterium]
MVGLMAELSEPSRSAPRRGRILRWLSLGSAAIVTLLLIAVLALQTPTARRMILKRATALLATQHISIAAEQFSYNLFDLSTNLGKVRVASTELPDAPPFLEVDRFQIDVSLWQLLRGKYVVQSGRAEGLRIHYFVDANGTDNLPRPPRDPEQAEQPLDYLIADLTVPNAAIRYENRAQGIDINLPQTSLSIAGHAISGRHDVTIEALGGDARFNERTAALGRVIASIDLGRDDMKIERGEIAAEGAQLNASGTVGPFEQPVLDIAVHSTINLARAVEVAKLQEPLSGQLTVDGTIKGPVNAPAFDGQVKGTNLQARELHDVSLDAAGLFDLTDHHALISRLQISGPAGAVSGRGTIAFAGTRQSSVEATVNGLNLELLMRAARLPYRLASTVNGQVSASWPGTQYQNARGQASLSLLPSRGGALSATVPVRGRIGISGDGTRLLA